jgi:hypothetical protein
MKVRFRRGKSISKPVTGVRQNVRPVIVTQLVLRLVEGKEVQAYLFRLI